MTIYLDHNASAPLTPAVRGAIEAFLRAGAANPSSVHLPGQRARWALDRAREQVGALLGCAPDEVVFTSGATEANLLAWSGVAGALPAGAGPARAVTTAVEHPSVLAASARWPGRVERIGVDGGGRLAIDALREALQRPKVALVSAMAVNNELGVRHPTEELAALARAAGAAHHCDATQAAGRLPIDVDAWGVDLLSISGHKLGALPGAGALFVRRGLPFAPPASGHQERGLRGGTENALGIVALGAAAEGAGERLAAAERVRALRDRLWEGLAARLPGVRRNGDVDPRDETGHTLNVSFSGAPADRLVMALDLEDIAASAGAACASGTLTPSHVLAAMGLSPARAAEAVRFSLGPETTAEEIDRTLAILPPLVTRIRGLSGAGP